MQIALPSRNLRRVRAVALLATVFLASLVTLVLATPARADWPVYGHDLANSRDAGAEGPPASQVSTLAPAWTFTAKSGDFTGTPAVADGIVVAGNNGGWIYALDAVSGKLLWSRDVGQPVNGSAAIDTAAPGGPLAMVPVAQTDTPRLIGLSLTDGRVRWDDVLISHPGADVFGSPTFWRGTAYIGTSGPNNDNTTARGSVVAIDEATGSLRWQTFTTPAGTDGAAVWSTPAIDPATGRLYVGTGNNYHQPATGTEDSILALDTSTGALLGHYQATANDTFSLPDNPAGPDYDFGASPNLLTAGDGRRLVGEGQKSGTYWALDRDSLQPVWKTSIGPGSQVGGIIGSTAFDGTRIFGADTISGQVFALGLDGSEPWQSPDAGGLHWGPTTVANKVVYTVNAFGAVAARDPATGALLGELPLNEPSFGGLSATGRALYVAVGTGPPPSPGPQQSGSGSIIAFGDTSRSGASGGGAGHAPPSQTRRPDSSRSSPRRASSIRLTVTPARVRTGRPVLLHFRATLAGRALAGATIMLAGRAARTGPGGRATMRIRLRRPGRYAARASGPGLGTAQAVVLAIRPRHRSPAHRAMPHVR